MSNVVKAKLVGVSPLLQHNGQLADRLCPATRQLKALSGKKDKTDKELDLMEKVEFMGGLYWNGSAVILPALSLEAALVKAAQKKKRGPAAKAGLLVLKDMILDYGEQLSPEELYARDEYKLRVQAVVNRGRVTRVRPMFPRWSVDAEVQFDPEQLNREEVIDFLRIAGSTVGVGDWRPRYGRFTVDV